ncbi:hypothetical protein FB45DRAFT_1110323 [Roridomyces roridus]|uniref:Uncharacterized protein n=1 Tax=Roridomyces roridus TaxID=1738132 RepID=A0AAD7B9Y3_9AGAR|nr:hypothetical protein FB45DRAFT_1110323 [Roridomyces roridus]
MTTLFRQNVFEPQLSAQFDVDLALGTRTDASIIARGVMEPERGFPGRREAAEAEAAVRARNQALRRRATGCGFYTHQVVVSSTSVRDLDSIEKEIHVGCWLVGNVHKESRDGDAGFDFGDGLAGRLVHAPIELIYGLKHDGSTSAASTVSDAQGLQTQGTRIKAPPSDWHPQREPASPDKEQQSLSREAPEANYQSRQCTNK